MKPLFLIATAAATACLAGIGVRAGPTRTSVQEKAKQPVSKPANRIPVIRGIQPASVGVARSTTWVITG